MNFVEYINAVSAKDTIGAYISLGIFALIGVSALLGGYYGATRGFSKSVIRFFTIVASAICSLFAVTGISELIVKKAMADGDSQSVDALLNNYFPGLTDSMPDMITPILGEMNSGTATIFVMMIVAIIITPVLFISFFYILKTLTFFVYSLLAGLTGAISYGKGIVSTLLGGAVGVIQGMFIAAVIIIPISGLCNVADEARGPLMDDVDTPNEYIETAYSTVINDLADNPVFDLVDKFGGNAAYERMITVKINGEKIDMGDECVGAIKVLADILPIANKDFDWKHPSEDQKDAFATVVTDIEHNKLIASLASDVMRGMAAVIKNGTLNLGLSGAAKTLVDDVMTMFSTTNSDTIASDLDLLVDIYFIMCDRNMIDTLTSGDPEALRDVLTNKDENGDTAADVILDRLNAYDRAHPIITSFTKLSLSAMQGALGSEFDNEELYESVKNEMTNILNHNKSDFETEEEYKEAVSNDLDKALADNNLTVDEDTKQSMVDYIADNYGDFEGEITDKEINDALLSYYKSYAESLGQGGVTPPVDEGNGAEN